MTAYLRQAHNLLSYIYGLVPVKASTEQVSLACLILCNRTLDLSLKSVTVLFLQVGFTPQYLI